MSEVILGLRKQLDTVDNKTKVMRTLLFHVLERKPSKQDYAMLSKLINDFGYDIVFDALVSVRYSDVDFNGKYWGYIVAICKNRLEESTASEEEESYYKDVLDKVVDSFSSFSYNQEQRSQILSGLYG